MKHSGPPSWLEEFADRHFWSLTVGIFIVFCFFSYGIGHAGATKGQVYTVDVGFYDAEQMKQPKNINGQNLWNNGTYSDTRINKNNVKFSIKDKISIEADLTINPVSGNWLYYPANISGNVISYSNTRGIIRYTDHDTILKEEIVLFEPVDSISWILNLSVKPQSLGFQIDPDGYSIRDPANTDQRIKIPFPYVVDSNGVRRNLTYGWNNGQKHLSLNMDFDGLVYPLVVDPVYEVDTSGTTGYSPVMLVNTSDIPQIGYQYDTGNFLRLAVNDSGNWAISSIKQIATASSATIGMTFDLADLPVFFSRGISSGRANITWFNGGVWRTCETESYGAAGGSLRGHIPIGVSTNTGRTLVFYSNSSLNRAGLNITRIENLGTGITHYSHQMQISPTNLNMVGKMNLSNFLNIFWNTGASVNWTQVTDNSNPTMINITVNDWLNSTAQQNRAMDMDIDPNTDFPGIFYIPATAASGATTGRAVNFSYFKNGKWYHESVFENTTSPGMSKCMLPGGAYNNSGYVYVAYTELLAGESSNLNQTVLYLTKRLSAGTWSTPIQIDTGPSGNATSSGYHLPSLDFDSHDNLHMAYFHDLSDDLRYFFEPLPTAIGGGAPPVASFTKNDTVLHLNEAINLSDTSSCYDCTNRQWNLTLEIPADSYHKNESSLDWTINAWPRWGYYSIVKYLQNASGSDDATDHFTVINITPQAVFTCAPLSGTRPLTTTCTHANTGNSSHFNWSAGDGTNISALANPSFTYTVAGSYGVNETIWGDDLEYSIELKNNYITVTDPAPPTTPVPGVGNCTGSIALNISNGYPPLWVNLSYVGNNTVIDNITWMFGEGNTSMDWSPTAVYNWSATFEASAYACNTTFNECCTATAKIWAWFFTCLQASEDGNIPVALMYLLVPLTMGLSLFAVGSYDNRVYANIILGGFGSSIMWFYLASNIITANVFYLASDPGCVMMDTPLFWLFVLFGVIMTVYSVALVVEAIMERNAQDLGGEQE